jgi:peptide/nickel transport system substrate-binding protein
MARIGQQVWGVTLALALAACEGAPARSKPWRHPAKDASPEVSAPVRSLTDRARQARDKREKRRHLVVAVQTDPGALDPLRSPSPAALWLTRDTVFEGLVRIEDGRVVSHLAAEIRRSPDGLTLDIALRPNVVFHDGRPLAASDVRWSLDNLRRGRGRLVRDLSDIAAVEVLDDRRLRLRLRRDNRYLERALAEVAIASNVSYFKVKGRGPNPSPAGTGPYRIAESGDRLERFDDYWGKPGALAPAIEIRVEPDERRGVALAQLGDVDVALTADAQIGERLVGARVVALAPAQFRYLVFNSRRELFADAEVRRAVSLAIDRERLVSDGHRGAAEAISAPVWPGGPVSAPAPAIGRTDMRAAVQLLEAAGWVRKTSRVRERGNQKLLAIVVTGDGDDPARDLVLDQMRAAGFVLDVRALDDEALEQALSRGEFDAAVLAWSGYPDWDLTSLLGSGGADNLGRLGSPEIDAALAALREAPSRAARAAIASRLVRALEQAIPAVFLTRARPRAVLGTRITGAAADRPRVPLRELARRPASSVEGP